MVFRFYYKGGFSRDMYFTTVAEALIAASEDPSVIKVLDMFDGAIFERPDSMGMLPAICIALSLFAVLIVVVHMLVQLMG